jgi:hypothetical protein
MVTVVSPSKTYVYRAATSANADTKGHLTVYEGLTSVAGFAPGAWRRYVTGDEEEKDNGGPLVA